MDGLEINGLPIRELPEHLRTELKSWLKRAGPAGWLQHAIVPIGFLNVLIEHWRASNQRFE